MPKDGRVDAYIKNKSEPFAQPILKHIRKAVHAASSEIEEGIKWGAPAFLYNDKTLAIMASFKAHVAISFHRDNELDFAAAGLSAKPDEAMGMLGKIKGESDLPADRQIGQLIKQAMALEDAGAAKMPKKKPVQVPPMPEPFADALASSEKAKATFDSFPPGAQRDYLEWVTEAKREATRDKRIATAVEWLAEGKKRHWKYENC